jgi:MFS family permease
MSPNTEVNGVDSTTKPKAFAVGSAMRFVILLGIVSLFADMTYEGARSITGPYLAILGASATVVGIVAGFGELIGYGLRLVSGYVSDRTGRYWAITLVGYVLNLLAVPLLALAGQWPIAAALMIAERTGKAIRSPARDAMLSHAVQEMGSGWGFGLHEAMDQIGAVLGPLIVAAILASHRGYPTGFAVLLIPAVLAIIVLLVARSLYPRPQDLEKKAVALERQGFTRNFWLYLAAIACVAAGFADFPLVAYHFQKLAIVKADWIPIFYAIAMGVDALAALLFGYLYDRLGMTVLVIVTAISAFFAPFVFWGGFALALLGVCLWGIGMGAQESLMRAAVARLVPANRRGVAYGWFNAGYGLAWFLGCVLMGLLYDASLPALVIFSVLIQLFAIPLFVLVQRTWPAER